MTKGQFSKAAAFAHQKHLDICTELFAAGFDFYDNGEILYSTNSGCSDDPRGLWAVNFQPDNAGHQMLVFSIHGNEDDSYGISYDVTLCGKPRSVAYWGGTDDQILLGNDADWPGLPPAVLKSRRLQLQHADLLIQLRAEVSTE